MRLAAPQASAALSTARCFAPQASADNSTAFDLGSPRAPLTARCGLLASSARPTEACQPPCRVRQASSAADISAHPAACCWLLDRLLPDARRHRRLRSARASRVARFAVPHHRSARAGWAPVLRPEPILSSCWSTTVDGARGQRSNPSPHRRATERASAPCSPAAVDTCACAAVQGGRRSEPGASERIELGAERAPYPSHITSLLDSTRPDLTRLDSTHCRAAHTQRAQRPQHERARRGERSELSDLAEASRTPVACGLGWPRVTAG